MESNVKRILVISSRADHGGGPKHLYLLLKHFSSSVLAWVAVPNERPYWDLYQSLPNVRENISIPHRRFSIKSLLALRAIILRNRIDLIHSHGKGGGIFGRILSIITGVKCIHTYHGIHVGDYNLVMRTIYLNIERIFAKFTSAFIAVSSGEHQMVAKLNLARLSKVHIIENGIEIPVQKISNPFNSDQRFNVLMVTRFNYQKNTELVLPIIKKLSELGRLDKFCFNFIGSGAGKTEVVALLKANNFDDAVVFHGDLDDISEQFQNGFCYLSTSRWEGLPLAVLEALSFGIPVVATDVVGNRDAIEHGKNGYLYDINFPERAVAFIIDLFENKERWSEISESCRNNFSHIYKAEYMAESTERLYDKVIF